MIHCARIAYRNMCTAILQPCGQKSRSRAYLLDWVHTVLVLCLTVSSQCRGIGIARQLQTRAAMAPRPSFEAATERLSYLLLHAHGGCRIAPPSLLKGAAIWTSLSDAGHGAPVAKAVATVSRLSPPTGHRYLLIFHPPVAFSRANRIRTTRQARHALQSRQPEEVLPAERHLRESR